MASVVRSGGAKHDTSRMAYSLGNIIAFSRGQSPWFDACYRLAPRARFSPSLRPMECRAQGEPALVYRLQGKKKQLAPAAAKEPAHSHHEPPGTTNGREGGLSFSPGQYESPL